MSLLKTSLAGRSRAKLHDEVTGVLRQVGICFESGPLRTNILPRIDVENHPGNSSGNVHLFLFAVIRNNVDLPLAPLTVPALTLGLGDYSFPDHVLKHCSGDVIPAPAKLELTSLKRDLGGPDFQRVRVGVGRPDSTDPDIVAAYVLGSWRQSAAEVADLVSHAADEAERIVHLD